MRIRDRVPQFTFLPEGNADARHCQECGTVTFHDVIRVGCYSPSGFRMVNVWWCEGHPRPDHITDAASRTV